jgi:hypothetical protein
VGTIEKLKLGRVATHTLRTSRSSEMPSPAGRRLLECAQGEKQQQDVGLQKPDTSKRVTEAQRRKAMKVKS